MRVYLDIQSGRKRKCSNFETRDKEFNDIFAIMSLMIKTLLALFELSSFLGHPSTNLQK